MIKYFNNHYWLRKIFINSFFSLILSQKLLNKIIFNSIYKSNHWNKSTKFRHNDTFRIRLLRKINLESSNIILSSTMKKANIESPKYNKFKNNILENEKNLYKNYLSSNYSKKFESILNDANFFEWIVKNKKIQNFFIDRLLGRNASLTNKLLNHDIVKKIILNQINGKKNNLRILLLLTTYENFINEMNKL